MTHTSCLHPRTSAARAACRRSATRRDQLVPMIREALDVCYVAATKERPAYDHEEYERAWRVARGLLIAFADGDAEMARGHELVWFDCQEFHPTADRDTLVYDMKCWADDASYQALTIRMGLHTADDFED